MSEFTSREDFFDTLMVSCFVPLYFESGSVVKNYRNDGLFCDGGFTNFIPVPPGARNNYRATCFPIRVRSPRIAAPYASPRACCPMPPPSSALRLLRCTLLLKRLSALLPCCHVLARGRLHLPRSPTAPPADLPSYMLRARPPQPVPPLAAAHALPLLLPGPHLHNEAAAA